MIKKSLILSACSFALLSLATNVSPAYAADLQTYEDNAEIVASGIVENLSVDEFVLNVSGQTINVDYREWDLLNFTDLREHLRNGEKVVITGEVDDNWFAEDEIEAKSIFFMANNNYYSVEDNYPTYNVYDYDRNLRSKNMQVSDSSVKDQATDSSMNKNSTYNNVTLTGEVTSLMDEKFTMQTDAGAIKVDMRPLSPDREESRLHVEMGDNVLVYGRLDENLLKNSTLTADSVVKLNSKNK